MTLLDQIEGVQQKTLIVSGGCHNCPMSYLKPTNFVPATLRAGKILWLGEGPGATEVETGEGFTGKSGEMMRREATAANVPEPWSFSNSVHCRPPENETPDPKAVTCCLSQYVLDEIRGYPIVVLVGSVAMQALFPKAKATHMRGNVCYHPDFPGQKFYSIYHPSAILRNPHLLGVFQQHMARLGRIARDDDPAANWHIVRGMEPLQRMMQQPLISLDFETSTWRSWEIGARITSLAVTVDGIEVAVVHESEPHFIAALELVRKFLEDPDKHVVGSNIAYDIEWAEREGEYTARIQNVYDVGIIWYEAGQYQQASLKQLVAEQLDGYRYLVHNPHLVKDPELLTRYNAEDVVHALALFKKGMSILGPKTRDLVVRVQGPFSLVMQRAQCHGMYVRQDYRQRKIDEYAEKRRAAVQAWKEEDPEFVPSKFESGKGLAQYLFEIRKLPVLGQSEKTGAPVIDKAVIKQWIREGCSPLKHLLTIREVDKLVGTYLTAYDKHVGMDSRVHPNHWLTSTDTSRPSSSDPNVYNVARNKEIRDLFGVPHGMRLVESDLSQIEFRIMVCLAKDENGIAGYLRGDDAHTMTARAITGNPTPTKEQRSQSKPVNFGFLYGASARTAQVIARDDYGVEWTDQQSEEFKATFMNTYRRIPELHADRQRLLIAKRGWFESVTGHTYFYRDWNHPDQGKRDHAFRSALNAEAQGPAANICFYIAVLANRFFVDGGFHGVKCVNSVYDSIMTEVPKPEWVPPVIELINKATQQAYEWVREWFVVPLVIEHATGESWGSLKEVK